MQPLEKPTHQFLAKIQSGETLFENVLVKVFLPRRMAEPLRLLLCPTKEQSWQLMKLFEFSLFAEVRGFTGKVEGIFKAGRIYSEGCTTTSWGLDLQETHIEAVPYDFARYDIRNHAEKPQGEVSGSFWLTPCLLLSPQKLVERSYTGEVKVETIRQLQSSLSNGLVLSFDFVYRHFDEQNGDRVSFSELVANFKDNGLIGATQAIQEKCLDALDDFLLITSFASRQRCICLGWEASDSCGHVTFYRRGFTIPQPKPNESLNDTLIDKQHFEAFLKTAYAQFIQIEPKEFIRQALHAVTAESHTVELKFIRLFSALETLVLKHRRDTSAEFVFAPNEWKEVEKELSKAVKAMPAFANDKTKRCRVYENFSGLNRISFGTAYADFCTHHQIKLDDLWPVCGKHGAISLTEIRNRLVHGVPLDRKQLNTVSSAALHLEWILERALLAMLGWGGGNSRVGPQSLQSMTSYLNWKGSVLD
jgi:hypothetical protein